MPIVDGTKITTPVDIELDADMTNISSINNALARYDLRFVEEVFPTKVLEISDRDNSPNQSIKK